MSSEISEATCESDAPAIDISDRSPSFNYPGFCIKLQDKQKT